MSDTHKYMKISGILGFYGDENDNYGCLVCDGT